MSVNMCEYDVNGIILLLCIYHYYNDINNNNTIIYTVCMCTFKRSADRRTVKKKTTNETCVLMQFFSVLRNSRVPIPLRYNIISLNFTIAIADFVAENRILRNPYWYSHSERAVLNL